MNAITERHFALCILHSVFCIASFSEGDLVADTFCGRMVVVGPVNLPVTRLFVKEIILECRQKHFTKVDLLGFEFEMGLFPNVLDEAKSKGIDIQPKYIPAEVFDKRAVEKNQVVFHDVAAIEVKPLVKGRSVSVQLTDFSVFYSQDSADAAAASIKEKGSKIVVERGQIVKISKDAKGIVTREQLTKHWTDWIDYWSVDFDFENKKEIIRRPKEITTSAQGELPGMKPEQQRLVDWEEVWTGDFIFENEWQSFRTKKDSSLELTSASREVAKDKKRVKIAVKVVDIRSSKRSRRTSSNTRSCPIRPAARNSKNDRATSSPRSTPTT